MNSKPLFTDSSRGRPFAKDPAVVRMGEQALLYYTLAPYGDGRPDDGYRIGIARSDDLDHWERIGEIAPEAEYERNGFCAPGALLQDGTLHLFYQSYGNGPKDAICHATSTDGVHFKRNPSNPIFSPIGDWNNGRAIDADIAVHNGTAYLYAATRDPTGVVQQLCVATASVNSGYGRNAWKQAIDASILKPEIPWEQDCIEAPAVLVRDGVFHMFYGGAYNAAPQQIGHAVSEDGLHWRRGSAQPFLPNGGPSEWNSDESGHPSVFVDNNRTHLFFQGTHDHGQSWSLSRVEIFWDERGMPVIAK